MIFYFKILKEVQIQLKKKLAKKVLVNFFLAYSYLGDCSLKKYFKYLGLALIMVFSFYYTDKISGIVLNKNPLMQDIKRLANNYYVKSVNAEIKGNTIIPGINGKRVNLKDSFYSMQELKTFNAYFLVYDEEIPEVSLNRNKDKIIETGNRNKSEISLVFTSLNLLTDYIKANNLKASLLTTTDTYQKNSYFEQINNDVVNFTDLENTLNLNKENTNICIVNDDNKDMCIKVKNYLVKPLLKLEATNYLDVKKGLVNGSIILIEDTARLDDLKLLLKEIKYKGLTPVVLSELISESNK